MSITTTITTGVSTTQPTTIPPVKSKFPENSTESLQNNNNNSEHEKLGFTLGGPDPYPVPEFANKHEKRKWMLQHLAGAFRVFARNGYLEGSAGHISIRDPVDPSTFWINPLGKHFGLMKASDMIQVDEDANVINHAYNIFYPSKGDDQQQQQPRLIKSVAINKAGFKIHSELHKSRPDVWAACHAHSIYGKAYSTFGKKLDMINQDVCIFYNAHDVYDDFGGIVLDSEEGKHIAAALGQNNKGLILKNHGLLTVGKTVDEAAYLFGLMERSCRIQLLVDSCNSNANIKNHNNNTTNNNNESLQKCLISDEIAQYTFDNTASPEILYQEFQPELEYETHLDDSYMK